MSHAIAQRMYDAFNRRDFDAALAVIAPDSRWEVVATGQTNVGHAGFLGWARGFTTQFPDAHIDVTGFVEQGDKCVTEFVATGTHASGKRVALPTCEVLTFAGGLIVRARIYFDGGAIARQLQA
jgi:steroid delta-isomerase-like uncharacterized protein